jgi:hypothetical protein
VTIGKKEAAPIARLRDEHNQTIGWVYLWDSMELSIFWIDKDRTAKRIDPPIDPNTLAQAKAVTTDAVTNFLEALSPGG